MSLQAAHRQSGVALLVALLVAALAAVVAMQVIERSQGSVLRSQALSDDMRAHQLALGMAALAQHRLQALANDATAAGLLEAWTPVMAIPGGTVQGRVQDWSGRFNLNALGHPDPVQASEAERAFERLLLSLGLDLSLARALSDWLRGEGPSDYASRQPPYRHAGVPMVEVSELRWVMDGDSLARLRPYVSALPDPVLHIHLNSTTPLVLSAVVSAMDVQQASQLLARRPFAELDSVLAEPSLSAAARAQLLRHAQLEGRWWMAEARVVMAETPRDYRMLLSTSGSGYPYRYFSQGAGRHEP